MSGRQVSLVGKAQWVPEELYDITGGLSPSDVMMTS